MPNVWRLQSANSWGSVFTERVSAIYHYSKSFLSSKSIFSKQRRVSILRRSRSRFYHFLSSSSSSIPPPPFFFLFSPPPPTVGTPKSNQRGDTLTRQTTESDVKFASPLRFRISPFNDFPTFPLPRYSPPPPRISPPVTLRHLLTDWGSL